jgi:hypothetical protein
MPIYIQEHKSSGEDITPGGDYWPRLTLDPQISMYIEGAEALGLQVDGVEYDVLRKPGLRPLKATPVESRQYTKPSKKEPIPRLYASQRDRDETPEEYGARCLAAIAEDPDKYYQRRIIVRLHQDRIDAQADVWNTALGIRNARHLNVWPRNPDSCKQWGRTCDYFSVCTGLASINDPLLFKKEERAHEELDSDAPKDKEALILLTQSSLRTMRACPRRYYLRYELRIRSLAPKSASLKKGTSLHKALETWNKTDGDIDASIASLDRTDEFAFQHERAMVIGYHVRWEKPYGVRYVEKEFRLPLMNPESGSRSRTFELGGRLDAVREEA